MAPVSLQEIHVLNHPDQRLLDRLTAGIGPAAFGQVQKTLQRLARECRRDIGTVSVMLPYGGGKDSTWTLAYVRVMQLLAQEIFGRTFILHVVAMVHPGVTAGVFENMDRTFARLEMENDANVRVIIRTLNSEEFCRKRRSYREEIRDLYKKEILFSAHRSRGNGRESFCYACNFNLMNIIARYVETCGADIDFVITGDSPHEIRTSYKWINQIASRLDLPRMTRTNRNWGGFFSKISQIGTVYYQSLYGSGTPLQASNQMLDVQRSGRPTPISFSIFEDTEYNYEEHSQFLNETLGFRLADDSFNFTESDCRNPIIMAHLRGLLGEFEGRGYSAGIREYLQLTTVLMRHKRFSAEMIDTILERYREEKIPQRKEEAVEFAGAAFGITETQLRSAVASPFIDGRKRFNQWLEFIGQPDALLQADLRKALETIANSEADDASLRAECGHLMSAVEFMERHVGLDPGSIKALCMCRSLSKSARPKPESALEVIRDFDPHKLQIFSNGESANSLITGR